MIDKVKNNVNIDFQLEEFLGNLGLSSEESAVYQALVKQGVTSTLKLAQATVIPRTNVYRILESLKKRGLAEEVIDEHRKLARATGTDKLEQLIANQKALVSSLETLLPEIKSNFSQKNGNQFPGTRVLFYRERSGIEQILWNSLKAQEIVGYTYLSLDDVVGNKIAQKYREERSLRKVSTREILSSNDPYLTPKTLKYLKQSPLFTYYQPRYLPAEKIKINHQVTIYNDTIAFYNWHKGEIFGVEIYNQNIANMQKQIFNLLWEISESLEVTLNRKRVS